MNIHRPGGGRRSLSTFIFYFSFILAGIGYSLSGPVVCYAGSGSEDASPEKSQEVLYGFAGGFINIAVTARIDPDTGGFGTASTGAVPFFANGAGVVASDRYLYVPNSFIDGQPNNGSQIFGYRINPTKGTLTPITGSPFFSFPPPVSIQGLAVTPDGTFLYGADANGRIWGFIVNHETGVPVLMPGSPFASGANSQLVVDPSGKFLYATDDDPSGGILAFKIDPIGALSPVSGSPFSIVNPSSDPDPEPYGIVDTDRFIYAALSGTNQIAAFSVDSETGVLSRVPGSPFAAGNAPQVFALANNFLYVVNAADGTISGYSVNSSSGALTPLPGSPFGSGGETLAGDPSGKYLYLGTFRGIQSYNVDSATGALTLGPGKIGEDGALWLTTVKLP